MNGLVQQTTDAHGGLEHWRRFETTDGRVVEERFQPRESFRRFSLRWMALRPDGTPAPDPLIVTIDLSEVEFA